MPLTYQTEGRSTGRRQGRPPHRETLSPPSTRSRRPGSTSRSRSSTGRWSSSRRPARSRSQRPLGYESDPSRTGTALLRHGSSRKGDVMTEDPAYTKEGFFADATPEDQRLIYRRGMQTMVDFHTIDWIRTPASTGSSPPDEAPDCSSGRSTSGKRYMRRELRRTRAPGFRRGRRLAPQEPPDGAWSPRSAGATRAPATSSYRDHAVLAITDFENIAVAPRRRWMSAGGCSSTAPCTRPSARSDPAGRAHPPGGARSSMPSSPDARRPDTFYCEVLGGVRYSPPSSSAS